MTGPHDAQGPRSRTLPRIFRRTTGDASVEAHTAGPTRRRTLTAAVKVLNGPRIERSPTKRGKSADTGWQKEAWSLYDEIGELRYASLWLAHAVGRCRLYAARVTNPGDDPVEVTDGTPAELVADFAGGRPGQAQFLERAAQQLEVAGETYIVGREIPPDAPYAGAGDTGPTDGDGPRQVWRPYSTEEVTPGNDGWTVNDGAEKYDLGEDDLLVRCWRPHPRLYAEADSPVRSSLPVLRELRALTMRVMSEIDSRLAGAGLLLLPEEMTFPKGQGTQDGDDDGGSDDFVETLIDYMVTPIRDRESAAAVVPLVVTAPGDQIGNAQHIKFWSELDDKSRELRDEALRRFALSADMPPEVILGMSDANHWSAWQISEEGIELHVAPLTGVICLALTVGWFRTALAEAGVADPDSYMVWFDPTDLLVRPDRSGDAKDLYDRGELGGDALRREAGFGDTDEPTPDELRRMVLWKLIDRVTDSTAISAILSALGAPTAGLPELDPATGPADQDGQDDEGQGPNAIPERTDDTGPGDDEPAAAVVAAAESAVYRALELAGKRLLTRAHRGQHQGVEAWRLHEHIPATAEQLDGLLDGSLTTLARVLPGRPQLLAAVEDYVRDLLRTGTQHQTGYLRAALTRAGVIHG